ncbi:solute carrier family 35 member G1-like [Tachypleus tridentatus]|uniref:solute carrier family 35 member G1-like n=1 Tax=Tachypleus tridentatus TaxID=6853 RepID=UPI003FCF4C58
MRNRNTERGNTSFEVSKTFGSPFQKIKFPGIGIILTVFQCIAQCIQLMLVKLTPGVSRQVILIYRGIYMAAFCVPIIVHSRHSFFPKILFQYLIICIRGITGTIGILFLYNSLNFLPLSDVTVLIKTEIIFTVILAFFILRETTHFIDVIAILLAIVGIILISCPSFIFGGLDSKLDAQSRIVGSLLAVGYGFFSSLTTIIVRRIKSLNYAVVIFHYCVIQTLLLYTYQFIVNDTVFPECGTVIWFILGIGILSFVTQYFYVNALYVEKASCVALVGSLEIVFSFIFQITITGEDVTLSSVVGAVFITLAVVMKACLQWYSESPESFWKALNKIGLRYFKR